jgi:hypothetical protein
VSYEKIEEFHGGREIMQHKKECRKERNVKRRRVEEKCRFK